MTLPNWTGCFFDAKRRRKKRGIPNVFIKWKKSTVILAKSRKNSYNTLC